MATHFRCTLRELADRITTDELPYWLAWSQIEPFGQRYDDVSRALVGAAQIKAWGGEIKVEDLIPKYDGQTATLPEEVAKEVANAAWLGFVEETNRRFKGE